MYIFITDFLTAWWVPARPRPSFPCCICAMTLYVKNAICGNERYFYTSDIWVINVPHPLWMFSAPRMSHPFCQWSREPFSSFTLLIASCFDLGSSFPTGPPILVFLLCRPPPIRHCHRKLSRATVIDSPARHAAQNTRHMRNRKIL